MDDKKKGLRYGVNDSPPVLISIAAAIQHILMSVAATLSTSIIIADITCAPLDHPVRSQLFSTSFFMVGVSTVVNSAVGIRLPIFQGPSASYLPPLLVMKTAGGWACPSPQNVASLNDTNNSINTTYNANATLIESNSTFPESPVQYHRLRELQGSLMLALAFEAVLGAFGLIGLLMRLIGPITFSVTITLIGISLYPVSIRFCGAHWGLSAMGLLLCIIFSMYMNKIKIPLPSCGKQNGKRKATGFPLFLYFPIALSIIAVWILCVVLTETNLLSSDPRVPEYRARTDVKNQLLYQTPWFYMPHPGQFGLPLFSSAAFVGFLASVISSTLESVGDYHAASSVCKEASPPNHAINRGIMVEGLMGVISGLLGSGHATTSYSGNIAVLGLTEIASRRVLILAGFFTMVLAVIGKFGAVLTMVPDPALGAVTLITYGNLCALGVFSLQKIDFASSRNLGVFGLSLYIAIVIPEWLKDNPNAIDTGNLQVNQVVKVILGTPMFLGSVISIILDNTVKGTLRERGMKTKEDIQLEVIHSGEREADDIDVTYLIPGISRLQRHIRFLRLLPFLPPFMQKQNIEEKCNGVLNKTGGSSELETSTQM